MSGNERGINLQTENDLGEGLPSYQVAIEEESRFDELKENKENTNGKSDASFLKSNNGITNNNTKKTGSSGESVSDSVQKPKLNGSKDIPNSNESQNVSAGFSAQNIIPGIEQKREPTTYVISNTRSCTLQLKSTGFVEIGSKKNKVFQNHQVIIK